MYKHLFCPTEFGFIDYDHFFNSLLRPKLTYLTIPIAAIGGFIDYLFGLQPIVFVAFVLLLSIELISGIFASWIENKPITSKRMKSFLMMLFVWLIVLFILNTFQSSYEGSEIGFIFHYLFDAVLIYVNVIYFKSIWENMGRISSKKKEFGSLSDIFSRKLDTESEDKKEEKNVE